ncbi:MAG: helix-hairpin-helix domain-containing protein [Cyclobacteriaceae bacterium]
MRRLIYHLVSIYGVSKTEAIGFTILIPTLFVVISTPLWFKYMYEADGTLDERYHREFKEWVAEAEASIKKEQDASEVEDLNVSPKYHDFDPNLAGVDELITLGFKPWIAERIVKYRSAGGRFSSPEDLSRIYGISKDQLAALIPYIKIDAATESVAENSPTREYKKYPDPDRPKVKIKDINSAVAEDLVFMRGIGPVLSERIVKYRDMLGGFSSLDQIDEVYGLDGVIADSLKQYFYLDSVLVKSLDVNYLKAEELRKHPYIDYKLANALEQYRIQHGDYVLAEDLLAIKIMDDSTFQKILPYLKID